MRKYLLLIFVLIIIVIALILYLPYEKEIQTTEISTGQNVYQKDTIVLSDSINRAKEYQILKYFCSKNKEYCFEYKLPYEHIGSRSLPPKKIGIGSLCKLIKDGRYCSVWRIPLYRCLHHVLVSNTGNYVIVFYPGFHHKKLNVLDIYNSQGKYIKKYVVEDLISENRMDEIKIIEKNGMKHWGSGELDEENDLVIVRMTLKQELLYKVTCHTVEIDLKTGELRPLQWKVEQPIHIPEPEYPETAKKAGIEGTAVVKVLVDTAGSIITVTEFQTDIVRTTPIGPEIEVVPYHKVEVKPRPKGNLQRTSEIAKKHGIECDVMVKALVDTDGCVIETEILKSSGYEVMDNEALRIAEKFKFTPARARPKSPRLWVVLPIKFRLDE